MVLVVKVGSRLEVRQLPDSIRTPIAFEPSKNIIVYNVVSYPTIITRNGATGSCVNAVLYSGENRKRNIRVNDVYILLKDVDTREMDAVADTAVESSL